MSLYPCDGIIVKDDSSETGKNWCFIIQVFIHKGKVQLVVGQVKIFQVLKLLKESKEAVMVGSAVTKLIVSYLQSSGECQSLEGTP